MSNRLEAIVQAVAAGDLDHREPDGSYPVTDLGRFKAEALTYRHGVNVAIQAFHEGRSRAKVIAHLKAVEAMADEARELRVVNDG